MKVELSGATVIIQIENGRELSIRPDSPKEDGGFDYQIGCGEWQRIDGTGAMTRTEIKRLARKIITELE